MSAHDRLTLAELASETHEAPRPAQVPHGYWLGPAEDAVPRWLARELAALRARVAREWRMAT